MLRNVQIVIVLRRRRFAIGNVTSVDRFSGDVSVREDGPAVAFVGDWGRLFM